MIIGQGQLDTVLNARPEDRRAIIEEAAGVLKHRRRRERAERRLAGTAENLERLGDLVREVRRQIRPLERQAAAARSHDTVATELLTIRRYLAGPELAELSTPPDAPPPRPGDLPATRSASSTPPSRCSTPRPPPPRPSCPRTARRTWPARSAGVQGLVERARGTVGRAARAGPRRRGRARRGGRRRRRLHPRGRGGPPGQRDRGRRPAETAARPERGRARGRGHGALEAEEAALRRRWADVLGDDPPEEALAKVAAPHRAPAPGRGARAARTWPTLDDRLATLEQRHAAAAVKADLLANESAALEETTARLEADVAAGRTASSRRRPSGPRRPQRAADEAEQAPPPQRRPGRGARARPAATCRGPAGVSSCAGVDGVVGSLLDLVEIDEGWEAGLRGGRRRRRGRRGGRRAPVRPIRPWPPSRERGDRRRAGAPAAPDSRRSPEAIDATSALLPARRDLPRARAPSRCGAMCGPVTARPCAESVLDALIGHAVRVDGWEEAIDLSLERDDLIVVTPEGDRFAATGLAGALVDQRGHRGRRRGRPAAGRRGGGGRRRGPGRAGPVPGRPWPRPGTPWPRRSGPSTATPRRGPTAAPTPSAPPRSSAAWTRSSRRPGRRRVEAAAAPGRGPGRAGPAARGRCPGSRRRRRPGGAWPIAAPGRGARRQELEVRVAGLAERRRVLAERQAEVERRLLGHAEERATAASAAPAPRGGGRRARPASKRWSKASTSASTASSTPCAATTRTRSTPCGPGGAPRATAPGPPHHRAAARCGALPHPGPRPRDATRSSLRSETLHEHIVRELGR